MSIVDKNAVLILGAGVSQPFGIPLGGGLIEQLANGLSKERGMLGIEGTANSHRAFESRLRSAALYSKSFAETPMYGAVAAQYFKPEGLSDSDVDAVNADLEAIGNLLQLLSHQTSESIDDFIVENPSYSRLAKICVAAKIYSLCHSADDSICRPQFFQARTVGQRHERNWIHLLINIVRNGIRTKRVKKDRTIQIITFNYDSILEYVLDAQFGNTESSYGDWRDYITVTHVHGKFGDLVGGDRSPASTAVGWSKGMYVVNEPEGGIPEPVRLGRAAAVKAIKGANKIYAVGFSFAPSNCRLIGLDSISSRGDDAYRPSITYCNYDGNTGVRLNAEKLRRLNVDVFEEPGTKDRPISVSDWLYAGHLGELP